MSKVTTRIERLPGDGKQWCKHVTRVDPSKTNGYALIGEWVTLDQSVELPVGAVLVAYNGPNQPRGARGARVPEQHFRANVRVMQALERGCAVIAEIDTNDRGWALLVRPTVESLLGDRLSDEQALDTLAALMSGNEWDADLLENLASTVRATGRQINDTED